jgi:hypothetical protein
MPSILTRVSGSIVVGLESVETLNSSVDLRDETVVRDTDCACVRLVVDETPKPVVVQTF